MEVLNNIWIAISTPNEELVNILVSLATFIESYFMISLSLSLSNLKCSKKQLVGIILILSIIGIFNLKIGNNLYNIFINYTVLSLILYLKFKNESSFFKIIISVVLAGIIFNIIGALLLNPFLNIFDITSNELLLVPVYRVLYICTVYIILTIILFIFRHKNLKIHFVDNIDKHSKIIIILNIILGIITLIAQSIITIYYIDRLPLFITFFSFISLLAYFILSIYTLTRIFKLTLTTKKLESAEEYNNTLRILHDNVRGFKHDFDNIVTTIGGFIRTNDMEGLKQYYLQLEDDCQRVNNLYILNPEIVNNDGIYNLLTKKYYEADSKDIKVNITFLLDLSKLNMKIYEFARILGILLDNAIEASSECEEKLINLTFREDSRNSRQLIIVENTYKNKDVDTEKIFEKGVSGKEEHSGLGLWEVRKIVKKNKNTNLFTTKNEKFFVQQLEIYY